MAEREKNDYRTVILKYPSEIYFEFRSGGVIIQRFF